MQLPIGWEIVKFGKPEIGEYYLSMDGSPEQQTEVTVDWWDLDGPGHAAVIIQQIKYRKAMRHDGNLQVKARFRDGKTDPWVYDVLHGYRPGTYKWKDSDGVYWKHCEILAP